MIVMAVFLASRSFPETRQSQSISAGMFRRWELLMLLKAETTFTSVPSRMLWVLSAAEPSIRSINLSGFPPILVSRGTVASIKTLPLTNSLIPVNVDF